MVRKYHSMIGSSSPAIVHTGRPALMPIGIERDNHIHSRRRRKLRTPSDFTYNPSYNNAMNGSCIFGFTEAETSGGFMKGKNMTIFELMMAAIVSSETCRYIEIDGKRYDQAIDIVRAYGEREILGYSERLDHGVRITLKQIENKAPERAKPETGDWILFDPEDQLTWPPLNVLVLTQSKTGRFGLEKLLDWKYGDGEIKWFEPNIGGVGPIGMNIAWHPLPAPFHMEQNEEE